MKNYAGRANTRDRTRMRATIDCMGNKATGSVLDLSKSGAGLYLSQNIPIRSGDEINFSTFEMGHLSGTVRWIKPPRIGVELMVSSNTTAKLESYYKMIEDAKSST